MKIPLLLAAVAAMAATANAQTKPLSAEGRFSLGAVPNSWIGTAPIPKDLLPMELFSDADPKLPAYPQRSIDDKPGVTLCVLPTYRGPMLQVEATDSSVGEVLNRVTQTWNMRAVIAPELSEQKLNNAVYRAFSPTDLLHVICEFSVEQWRSPNDTFFFADKTGLGFAETLAAERAQEKIRELIAADEKERRDNADPFHRGNLKPIEPQPNWEKREFNGRAFYRVPLPKN